MFSTTRRNTIFNTISSTTLSAKRTRVLAAASVAMIASLISGHTMAAGVKSGFNANNCTAPVYKTDAVIGNEQGLVKLVYEVNAEGKVVEAKIVQSSGFASLDNASVRALKECNFKADAALAKETKTAAKIAFDFVLN